MASIFGNITILNKQPRTKKVGGILIDGLLEEVHNRNTNVTRIPVEDGSIISDHITNEPDGVTIKGTISNTPMLWTTLEALSSSGNVFGDRVTEAFEAIEQLRLDKKEVSVSTILKLYTGMVIEKFTPVKDQTTGQSMSFTMSLIKITKVSNQSVAISNDVIGGSTDDQLVAQNELAQGQTVGQTPPTDTTIFGDAATGLGG